MDRYYVSAIVRMFDSDAAWLYVSTECELDIAKSLDCIERLKTIYFVLSAWVDAYDSNDMKHLVYHECNVDQLGNVRY